MVVNLLLCCEEHAKIDFTVWFPHQTHWGESPHFFVPPPISHGGEQDRAAEITQTLVFCDVVGSASVSAGLDLLEASHRPRCCGAFTVEPGTCGQPLVSVWFSRPTYQPEWEWNGIWLVSRFNFPPQSKSQRQACSWISIQLAVDYRAALLVFAPWLLFCCQVSQWHVRAHLSGLSSSSLWCSVCPHWSTQLPSCADLF